jgi:hypothetical protein
LSRRRNGAAARGQIEIIVRFPARRKGRQFAPDGSECGSEFIEILWRRHDQDIEASSDNCKEQMKRTIVFAISAAFAMGLAVQAGAVDYSSFSFNDRLLSMSGPGAPVLFENEVIFTASSRSRRVGIAFAHEGFSRVHWFKKLMTTTDEDAPL